jgi:rfaE bifunctional protein nucleotidyltransferase chain/domain
MNKVLSDKELVNVIEDIKKNNKKIILTNGCFDILHIGHAKYLQEARKLGDYLFIGVNSDSSVKKLKGENRPINKEHDRAELLTFLESVDYAVIFEEQTADNLIKKIKPNVYVKGGDYTRESLPEASTLNELDIDTAFIKFEDGYSTTNVIKKINS